MRSMGMFVIVGGATAIAVLAIGCTTESDGPGDVLSDYESARNSRDVDAVMAFYAEDAIVEDHPRDGDGIATGVSEIRSLETSVAGVQGPTGGIEFTDMVVSGDTVTFSHEFHNAAGDCFAGMGDQVTVEDGKITRYAWGSAVTCES